MSGFSDLMNNGFGVVTVMDICIYPKIGGYLPKTDCCNLNGDKEGYLPSDYDKTKAVSIDTLKISNLNQEGATKTVTGGKYATPLIKWSKTTTLEMQDALCDKNVLSLFYGADVQGDRVSIGDRFATSFGIEGKTYFIDKVTGEEKWLYIWIPQFNPDGIFNLVQDAEGDAAVFDLNGSAIVTIIRDNEDDIDRKIAYELRERSFFAPTVLMINDILVGNSVINSREFNNEYLYVLMVNDILVGNSVINSGEFNNGYLYVNDTLIGNAEESSDFSNSEL